MLTVVKLDEEKTKIMKKSYWLCQCDCGNPNFKSILQYHIIKGNIRSCGCLEHPSGENNPNWKGGVTPERQAARETKEYKDWRDAVYAKDWYTCQCCGKSKNINKQAHHIQNFATIESLRYDVSNGITLCDECHYPSIKDSFHNIYGTWNNTPAQLEEYINNKRQSLNIDIPFVLEKYINGEVLKPNDIIYKELKEKM